MGGYIISIDPGMTTGLVVASNVNYEAETYDLHMVDQITWDNRADIGRYLQLFYDPAVGRFELDAIVIEDFVLYANKAKDQINSRFPSVSVIERATVYAELLGCAHLITLQMAGLRKSVLIPDHHYVELKRKVHATAAYQHLRYYVLRRARAKPKAIKKRG